jgi:hypothetical protein
VGDGDATNAENSLAMSGTMVHGDGADVDRLCADLRDTLVSALFSET